MDDDLSLTFWIGRLKGGDPEAARVVWDRFFGQVCALARVRMGHLPRRSVDEEDVALSAVHALCQGARDGRFRRLEDRDDLWQLLALITCRKVANLHRRHRQHAEVGESAIGGSCDSLAGGLEAVMNGHADEAFLNTLSLLGEEMLARLDPKLRVVALLKLEGYTNQEIADRQERSVKTIERYLQLIRHQWASRNGA